MVISKVLINSAGLNAAPIANLINEQNIYKEEFIKAVLSIKVKKFRESYLSNSTENSLGLHATIDLGKGIGFGPSAYVVDELTKACL